MLKAKRLSMCLRCGGEIKVGSPIRKFMHTYIHEFCGIQSTTSFICQLNDQPSRLQMLEGGDVRVWVDDGGQWIPLTEIPCKALRRLALER